MESSIHSFALTVSKILGQIDKALQSIQEKRFEYDPEINISEIDFDNDSQYDDLVFGNKIKVLFQDIDLIKWEQDLRDDQEKLQYLLAEAQKITADRDAKLANLKELIAGKVNHPMNEDNRKILIFTAYADTADYLYENIASWSKEKFGLHSAMVNGSDSNKSTLKALKRKDLISILTQLVNFWPNMELDEYFNLENRVKGQMVVLDISATGEENIIEYDENREMHDLEYRKKQLIKLKRRVPNRRKHKIPFRRILWYISPKMARLSTVICI